MNDNMKEQMSEQETLKAFRSIGEKASFHLAGEESGSGLMGYAGMRECKRMFMDNPKLRAEMMLIGEDRFIFAPEMREWLK